MTRLLKERLEENAKQLLAFCVINCIMLNSDVNFEFAAIISYLARFLNRI